MKSRIGSTTAMSSPSQLIRWMQGIFDDALSLKKIDDKIWEVGVHIADVSHYVSDQTATDREAKNAETQPIWSAKWFQCCLIVYPVESVAWLR